MPTIAIIGQYRFFFYSNERQEPAHVHVEAAEKNAKFWLSPVELASNKEFRSHELSEIEALVNQHAERFLEDWRVYFAK